MARARISDEEGLAALMVVVTSQATVTTPATDRTKLATAVRYLLQLLAEKAPGHTLEVRVPPFGAVQCVEGPRHTRGTPPNVIEMAPLVWVALATGQLNWDHAMAEASVHASGTRAELRGLVPVVPRSLSAALRRSAKQ